MLQKFKFPNCFQLPCQTGKHIGDSFMWQNFCYKSIHFRKALHLKCTCLLTEVAKGKMNVVHLKVEKILQTRTNCRPFCQDVVFWHKYTPVFNR